MLIAYHRGRLPIEQGVTNGLMAATGMPADVARRRLAGSNVVMACDNSPSSTTISGEHACAQGRQTQTLNAAYTRAADCIQLFTS